jgi:two-component system sensor histidine kinase KdpD
MASVDTSERDQRPSPEALLRQAGREGHGRLKIFLGAAHWGVRIDGLDEGEGNPADEIERIFCKFHRVQDGSRPQPGIGRGIAICCGFVTAMGGTIRARNRDERRGADFIIEFPLP